MIAPTELWPRWSAPAAVAAPLLLAVVAVPIYLSVGPTVAIALVAVGSMVLVTALLAFMRRRLGGADDEVRLAERALEAVPQALFVVDSLHAGRPNRYVNPAYAALTGYGVAEAVSDGFDALAIFADPANVTALEAGVDVSTNRVTVRRRDGALLAAKLELRAVSRGDGGRSLIGLLEPITSSASSAELKPPARPEILEVSTAPTGRPKDAFLSALSHDLRSPLNACTMWLDVLALAPQPDKLTHAVDALKRNLARQTRLISDLNDAAKISSGGLDVRLEPLDLVALIRRHVDTWQLLAIGKQLTFQHRIEPNSAQLEADPARLTQALNHLIENSINSTPAGGRVELRVRNSKDACIVEIEDTGTALSAEDAANLHAPLWRAPGSLRTRPGLGLGLAVAHHLAEKHRGTLSAASTGSGTVFTLMLPLAAAGELGTNSSSTDGRSADR